MKVREAFPRVGFGTSGVRALVDDLTPEAVWAYAQAFAETLPAGQRVLIGWDLRPSSPRIAANAAAALRGRGHEVQVAGAVPTPALALAALERRSPALMVTGSHIPFDRNGIKFYSARGEIDKEDERRIAGAPLATPAAGAELGEGVLERLPRDGSVLSGYRARYAALQRGDAWRGWRLGVYQHSAVGRDLLGEVLAGFGAEVVELGRSDSFVPIDTEAVSEEDEARAAAWAREHRLDAVVSTDGDGDRPWLCDAQGRFIPGDLLGPLTARWLGVRELVTPINANSVVERCGWFEAVERTRIGSPYVLAAMAARSGRVAGYEGNGGFLLDAPLRGLAPLPTRDALLPLIAVIASAVEQGLGVAELRASLPPRFTANGRLQDVDPERVAALLARLRDAAEAGAGAPWGDDGATALGEVASLSTLDGVRLELVGGSVVHLRASGNAPELRVYVEAERPEAAARLRDRALELARRALT